MSEAILYIFGCISFGLAVFGAIGVVAMFLSDFEVSGMGVAPRRGFEVSEVARYVMPAIAFLAGLILFIAGWPS
ncbi:MAG: hypothetical protein KKB37_10055 [Alphaproteobacteria bacterium]|nr:hypothetical protein [Alphaproteobacteria bacterium]